MLGLEFEVEFQKWGVTDNQGGSQIWKHQIGMVPNSGTEGSIRTI